ncbi:transposase [Clostridium tagluense]|uniref:IS66 family transposase n=1 Tax=Clostridium tagluense TaxID=360422 RepID=UPI001CF36007|nr:transposase [Clostridium tagluense]MCB2313688.1 transposase [Clostridium tagluense]MCB2318538.1 transposase [Clostridium tagluense]MCB2323350.1 transposase [Clostridium tagluense]MCB2328357.1 transposase [Clostridium tagluense]MCB2333181.1 transposase [Clostridium tagluense]
MDDTNVDNYNNGITEIITLLKEMNSGLINQISNLNVEVVNLNHLISSLRDDNTILLARNIELEAMHNKNSNNSSKPPSSNNNKKPSNSRTKTGRSSGGQVGHIGKTLLKIDNPDNIIDIRKTTCNCGCSLSGLEGKIQSKQVVDLPQIVMKVTEYRTHEVVCPDCNEVHTTEFPATVSQPVQYGENLQALMVYLSNYQLVPLARTTEIIKNLTGKNISQGTIVNANKRLYDSLEKFEEAIKEQLKKVEILHTDESGLRLKGKINWVHAECNAHNMRILKGIHENFGHTWAINMGTLLIEIKRQVDSLKCIGATSMAESDIKAYDERYKIIIAQGKKEDAEKCLVKISKKTGNPVKSYALRLLRKLEEYDIETLSFMYDFNIPFDNNLAERDIRMVKLRQKISGCFRSDTGGSLFCRIRSYISTCNKNGQDIMESLKNAIKGDPFIPKNI